MRLKINYGGIKTRSTVGELKFQWIAKDASAGKPLGGIAHSAPLRLASGDLGRARRETQDARRTGGFAGGRLSEYLDEEQTARIDEVAAEVYGACGRIEGLCGPEEAADPFGFLLELKRTPLLAY